MELVREGERFEVRVASKSWACFDLPRLGGVAPTVAIETVVEGGVAPGWQRIRLSWELAEPVCQGELALAFHLHMEPDFWWAPHLAPEEGDCIAQHVFRSPALIVSQGDEIGHPSTIRVSWDSGLVTLAGSVRRDEVRILEW